MSTTANVSSLAQNATKSKHFRPDIQGMRAIAVLVVLFYHGTDGAIFPGGYIGVDIFFVISGFLITGHLIRTGMRTGRIDLADFYARRVRRILPAATVVLIFTAATTLVILPTTRWGSIGTEILASSLYLVNWVFAINTNYLNADVAASPIQHYWTLAVEEQFYIIWPAFLMVLLYFARPRNATGGGRNKTRTQPEVVQRYIGWGALAITAMSLAFSVFFSEWDPARAYFVTPTRLWELGIGAIVAAYAYKLEKISMRLGFILGSSGFLMIVASSLFYDSSTVFPGYAALLPTLGAAAVIVGGMSGRAEAGVGAILGISPMRWVGDLSYSLYLWHWPLIVIGTYLLGGELSTIQGLAIVLFSFIPAWLSYHYVENPVRNWSLINQSSKNALKIGAILMVVSAVAGAGVKVSLLVDSKSVSPPNFGTYSSSQNDEIQLIRDETRVYGAEALVNDLPGGLVVNEVESFYPTAATARQDLPIQYSMGCQQTEKDTQLEPCVLGDPNSDYVVALVGDSHADHWVPALDAIAKAYGWRLETFTKSSCPLVGTAVGMRWNNNLFYPECYSWNENAVEYLTGPDAPNHVIVSGFLRERADVDNPDIRSGSVAEGYEMAWNQLKEAGVPLTVLLDTPFPRIDVPECVAGNEDALANCAVPRTKALENGAPDQREAAQAVGVPTIDLTDYFCTEEVCPAVIGEVLVYRDTNHVTATYARSLASALERELRTRSSLSF